MARKGLSGYPPARDNRSNNHQSPEIDSAKSTVRRDDLADQLNRRRDAALRLPPLPDGRRDPWAER